MALGRMWFGNISTVRKRALHSAPCEGLISSPSSFRCCAFSRSCCASSACGWSELISLRDVRNRQVRWFDMNNVEDDVSRHRCAEINERSFPPIRKHRQRNRREYLEGRFIGAIVVQRQDSCRNIAISLTGSPFYFAAPY